MLSVIISGFTLRQSELRRGNPDLFWIVERKAIPALDHDGKKRHG
jgi:hypothetical protein